MSKYYVVLFLFLVFNISPALAYVASSSHYRIQVDSINFAGGVSSSTNYGVKDTLGETGGGFVTGTDAVRLGYRYMLESNISVSAPSTIAMGPEIVGKVDGGGTRTANGSAVIKVITDDPAGYVMYVKSLTAPALKSGDNSFADYVDNQSWVVGEDESAFGFNVTGSDAVSANWSGFSTANKKIAEGNSNNQPVGTDTVINVRATIGGAKKQPAGNYIANLVVTVLPL